MVYKLAVALVTVVAFGSGNAYALPWGGTVTEEIISGSAYVDYANTDTVLTTPAHGDFLLTTICGTRGVKIRGASFGFIAEIRTFPDIGWQCYDFTPGVALPKNEEITCSPSCGVDCSSPCQVSGILRKGFSIGKEKVISSSALIDVNQTSVTVLTTPSDKEFTLTTVCADTQTVFEGDSFGFIAQIGLIGANLAGDKRLCYNFTPGVALPKGEDIICREPTAPNAGSRCQVSGVLSAPSLFP